MSISTRFTFTVNTPVRALLFSTLSLLSTQALAGSPVPYNQWTVNNGVIDASATCNAAGVSCTLIAEDDGFLQQEVTTANGSFTQMILTEPGANGSPETLGFITENFVPTNNLSGWDINNQQIIRDPAQGFEQVSVIDREPFYDANNTLVDLLQVDLQQTLTAADFNASFSLLKDEALFSTGELYSGQSIDINQALVAADAISPTGFRTAFDVRIRSGWDLSNADNTLQTDPFAPASSMTLNDGFASNGSNQTLTWDDGDSIKDVWLSQYSDNTATTGYAFQRVENLTSGASIKESHLTTTAVIDPFDWDAPALGTAPKLP